MWPHPCMRPRAWPERVRRAGVSDHEVCGDADRPEFCDELGSCPYVLPFNIMWTLFAIAATVPLYVMCCCTADPVRRLLFFPSAICCPAVPHALRTVLRCSQSDTRCTLG